MNPILIIKAPKVNPEEPMYYPYRYLRDAFKGNPVLIIKVPTVYSDLDAEAERREATQCCPVRGESSVFRLQGLYRVFFKGLGFQGLGFKGFV